MRNWSLFLVVNPQLTAEKFPNQLNESKATEGRSLNALDTGQTLIIKYDLDEPQIDQTFRDVLQFIADWSDVELKAPLSAQSDTRVHLLSEKFTPKCDFVFLATTDAVQQFMLAW